MAKSLNKVQIIGNLGKNPENRALPSGKSVSNFVVATSESWKDKQSGELKEVTEWHKVVVYGGLADVAGKYLNKGSKVYIEGKLVTRKWQGPDGQDRYTTEINASELLMLDQKPAGQGQQAPQYQQQQQQQQAPQYQQPAQQQQQAPQQPQYQQAPAAPGFTGDASPSDVPF